MADLCSSITENFDHKVKPKEKSCVVLVRSAMIKPEHKLGNSIIVASVHAFSPFFFNMKNKKIKVKKKSKVSKSFFNLSQ